MSLAPIQICYLSNSAVDPKGLQAIAQYLPEQRYKIVPVASLDTVRDMLMQTQSEPPECLIVWGMAANVEEVAQARILLPTIVIQMVAAIEGKASSQPGVSISPEHLSELPESVEKAIAGFLKQQAQAQPIAGLDASLADRPLSEQQQRLSVRLKERLGFLGVYYKRDPKRFVRYLPEDERKAYLEELRQTYRAIVLEYFKDRSESINQSIDRFVSLAFLGDISVSQVLEIHMNLMDGFVKQLKIEGRSEDILLDYRITLIDIIAHLCEMYRRALPKEG